MKRKKKSMLMNCYKSFWIISAETCKNPWIELKTFCSFFGFLFWVYTYVNILTNQYQNFWNEMKFSKFRKRKEFSIEKKNTYK